MARGSRSDVIRGWLDRLLGRPRKITPFALEDGGRIVGDPGSPEGAVIEGGTVRIHDDWEVEVDESGTTAVFRPKGSDGTSGSFTCKCSIDAGECTHVQAPDGTLRCINKEGNACLGECQLKIKVDRKRFALQIY
jgi:hypothetical protein